MRRVVSVCNCASWARSEGAKQVEADARAGVHPVILVEILVRIVLCANIETQVGQQVEHLFARLGGRDAYLVILLAQFGAIDQCQFLKFGNVDRDRHQFGLDFFGNREIGPWRDVHQSGEFALGKIKFNATTGQQTDGVEQQPLIGQGFLRAQ